MLPQFASYDECLQEEVGRALRYSGYPELRRVRVNVVEGRVQLEGEVSRYFLKQIAQTAALSAANGSGVDNELLVC